MTGIGGNKTMMIQKQTGTEENAIGEQVPVWSDAQSIVGWLDTMTGTSGYTSQNAKIQDSTDVFVADYVPLAPGIKAETTRAIIDGQVYDVMFIDDPMGLNEQLEIFLKYTGGQ